MRKNMQEVVDLAVGEIASIRTGRATPGLVQDIAVSVYGGQQRLKINELATVTVSDAQTIVIDPWDKSIIGELRQGILSANVGLNPSIDGEVVRISIPPMTSEDRENFVRLLSNKIENARIMIRQIRGEIMRDIKERFEAKELSEDEKFSNEKKIQALTDEYIGKVEEEGERKKQELLRV